MKLFRLLLLFLPVLVGCSSGQPDALSEVAADPVLADSADRIVILGDLQTMVYYSENNSCLEQTAAWIGAQLHHYPGVMRAVLQTGDITETNAEWEWRTFHSAFMGIGSKIPLIICTGNHDYDWLRTSDHFEGINDRSSTLLDRFAPSPAAETAVVARFHHSSVCNAVYRITFAGRPLYLLVLEFGPRREVVEWAFNVVRSHPEERFILLNHEFLKSDGDLTYGPWSHAFFQWIDGNYVSPDKLWEQLIYPNDNIRAIVCGHNGFCRLRLTPNASGRQVPQVMFNLQYQPRGGDGLIMLWKDIPGDSVEVTVYNVLTRTRSSLQPPFRIPL